MAVFSYIEYSPDIIYNMPTAQSVYYIKTPSGRFREEFFARAAVWV